MLASPIKAIKRTMAYGKRFGVVYSVSDITTRLISGIKFSKENITKLMREKGLAAGRGNNKYVRKKLKMARNMAKYLSKSFPKILMIGVTGSVAAGYPHKTDDIDLIIITRRDGLWYTRLILRWFIFINRIPHRRYGQEERTDEFCFNLWLDEDVLCLPKRKRNLKNAMDLILMKPLINKESIYESFVAENIWVRKFVANGYDKIKPKVPPQRKGFGQKRNWIDYLVNWAVFWPQYFYMKAKIGKGLIDTKRAFFHSNTNR